MITFPIILSKLGKKIVSDCNFKAFFQTIIYIRSDLSNTYSISYVYKNQVLNFKKTPVFFIILYIWKGTHHSLNTKTTQLVKCWFGVMYIAGMYFMYTISGQNDIFVKQNRPQESIFQIIINFLGNNGF